MSAGPAARLRVWPIDLSLPRAHLDTDSWNCSIWSAPASACNLRARRLLTVCIGCNPCRPSAANVNLGFVTGAAVGESSSKRYSKHVIEVLGDHQLGVINFGSPAGSLERQHQRIGRSCVLVVERANVTHQPGTCDRIQSGNCGTLLDHGDESVSGNRHPIAEIATFQESEVLAFGDLVDTVLAVVAAHGARVALTHPGDQASYPRDGVVARVVRDREVAARLEYSGDLTQREPWWIAMQRLRGSDDIEMTRQERQRLNVADNVQPCAEAVWQTSDEFDRVIDAEHLMTGIAQHRSKATAACP